MNTIEIIKNPELYEQFLGNVLVENDIVFINDEPNIQFKFANFAETFHGRLGNPGCIPGRYLDRKRCSIKRDEGGGIRSRIVETKNLLISEPLTQSKIEQYKTWYINDLKNDFKMTLPKTIFMESDVVKLIDKNHSKYSSDSVKNQFTVFRVEYDKITDSNETYVLRKGPKFFRATVQQLELAGDSQNPSYGPVRLYEAGQKLKWKSLQAEVEFNILIGYYEKLLNTKTWSYNWTVEEAAKEINSGRGNAILKTKNGYVLVKLQDEELANDFAGAGDELVVDVGVDTVWNIED